LNFLIYRAKKHSFPFGFFFSHPIQNLFNPILCLPSFWPHFAVAAYISRTFFTANLNLKPPIQGRNPFFGGNRSPFLLIASHSFSFTSRLSIPVSIGPFGRCQSTPPPAEIGAVTEGWLTEFSAIQSIPARLHQWPCLRRSQRPLSSIINKFNTIIHNYSNNLISIILIPPPIIIHNIFKTGKHNMFKIAGRIGIGRQKLAWYYYYCLRKC
jgi:hypothetical protein